MRPPWRHHIATLTFHVPPLPSPPPPRCPIDSFKIQLPDKGWVAGQPTVDNHWTFSSPNNPIPFPLPVQLTSVFGDTGTIGWNEGGVVW